MKITLYYNNGQLVTLEGEQEELQKHVDVFNEDDNNCFLNYGEPTHTWSEEKGWSDKYMT